MARQRKPARVMIGVAEGNIAPRLVKLLRRWRVAAGSNVYLLGDGEGGAPPSWPAAAWRGLLKAAGVDAKPQALRSTWTATAASMSWPPWPG